LKFKFVIIFFNVVILLFLGVVFVVPFLMLGWDQALGFWANSWFLLPVLLAVLLAIDVYFALNGRVFALLEKEDWPALVQELEGRVLHKGNYSPRQVRLLANSYLVLSDAKAVNNLERKLSMARPALVNANALTFGAARLLAGDNKGAVAFFADRLPGSGLKSAGVPAKYREWLSWYYGFAQLLDRQFGGAADRFALLAGESRDGIITGLSSYFLNDPLKKLIPARAIDIGQFALEGKERVKKVLKRRENWNKEVKGLETEVHAMVLQTYITKAGDYLYS
jgi:hypothetical protein